ARLRDLEVVGQVGGTRLGDQELAKLLLPPLHTVGDRVQHAGTVVTRALRPGAVVEGAPGGGDGAPHVVDGRVGRGADRLLGRGVGDGVGPAVRGLDPLPVDEHAPAGGENTSLFHDGSV